MTSDLQRTKKPRAGLKLRILHIIDSGGLYGAEIMLLNLMEQQKLSGLYPILGSIGVRNGGEKDIESAAVSRGLKVRPFRMTRGFSIRGIIAILRFARENNIDLIHSHGYKGDIFFGSIPKMMRDIPVVSTLHGWTTSKAFSKMKIYEILHKLCLRNINMVAVVNNASGKILGQLRGKITVIENGIKDIQFDPRYVEKDKKFLESCANCFVVGSIGRLSAEKGYSTLVTSIKLLREKHPDVKMIIIGEGSERESLERLVAEYNMSDCVSLLGYRDKACQYIPFFDVFVLPSFSEGLPITLLEAMQATTPIVATRVGGVPELLRGGDAGILVEPGDCRGLAKAIDEICRNAVLRKQITSKAREVCFAEYSPEKMNLRYLNLYRRVLLAAG